MYIRVVSFYKVGRIVHPRGTGFTAFPVRRAAYSKRAPLAWKDGEPETISNWLHAPKFQKVFDVQPGLRRLEERTPWSMCLFVSKK